MRAISNNFYTVSYRTRRLPRMHLTEFEILGKKINFSVRPPFFTVFRTLNITFRRDLRNGCFSYSCPRNIEISCSYAKGFFWKI